MKLFLQTKNGADGLPMIGAMAELGLDMTALADVLASSGLPCHIETQSHEGRSAGNRCWHTAPLYGGYGFSGLSGYF